MASRDKYVSGSLPPQSLEFPVPGAPQPSTSIAIGMPYPSTREASQTPGTWGGGRGGQGRRRSPYTHTLAPVPLARAPALPLIGSFPHLPIGPLGCYSYGIHLTSVSLPALPHHCRTVHSNKVFGCPVALASVPPPLPSGEIWQSLPCAQHPKEPPSQQAEPPNGTT